MIKSFYIKSITIITFVFLICFSSCFVLANEVEVTNNTDNVQEQENIEKKELLNIINKCINDIAKELKLMDDSLKDLDKTEEYEKYPAVRLNIDTPFFGLDSMINNKLKIKNDVSTVDVANGYSIKNIVNDMSIKLPDVKVGNIVISTRDVKFDDTISIDDAKNSVLKLVQYISQVNNTSELLDKRINKIFESYIPKEKTEKISDLNKKLDNISSNVISAEDSIITLKLLDNDEETQNIVSKYYDINNKVYSQKEALKNVLISKDKLNEVEKLVADLEVEQINYTQSIEKLYNSKTQDINIEEVLLNVKIVLEEKQKLLNQYADNSVLKEEICLDENNNEGTCENKQVTEKTLYDVTSKYLIEYEKTLIDNIDSKVNYYSVNDNNSNEISKQNRDEVLKEIIKIYKDYISKEDKFYLDNLNYLLKDTTYKLAKLPDYTDTETVTDIEYIYIKLPQEVEELLNKYSTKSTLQSETLSGELYKRILVIVKFNIQINKECNRLGLS